MTTTRRIRELVDSLCTVTGSVYHVRAYKAEAPYLVWMEDGTGDALRANGATEEQAMSGTIHLFEPETTAQSLYPAVQKVLNSVVCAWSLNSIQYEEDTGLAHYEWVWEVC